MNDRLADRIDRSLSDRRLADRMMELFPPLPTTVILMPSSLILFVKLSFGTADWAIVVRQPRGMTKTRKQSITHFLSCEDTQSVIRRLISAAYQARNN